MADAVYSSLEDLIALRFHVKQRRLTQQQKLVSEKGGYHQAVRKGRGMEFNEVREYTAGDDIRHIDWKVSARTQKTHTKVFTEEVEKPIIALTEQTPNLFFGSQVRFKSVQALNVMAAIGWISLHQGDRFGGLVFNHQQHHWVEPKHQAKAIMQLLHQSLLSQQQLTSPAANNEDHWLDQLTQLQKRLRPGSRLFLIGDFLTASDGFFQKLSQLKKHADINVIHIFDPLEKALPSSGQLNLTDGENEIQLNSDQAVLLENYRQAYDDAWQTLQNNLATWHIPLMEISTQQDPIEALMRQGVIR